MRICECCGREFEPKQERSKYCSRQCQIRGHYQNKPKGATKKCAWCGETFFAENKQQKYCSVSCRNQASYEQTKERTKSKFPPKECKHCGKEFAPTTERQIFCSKTCASRYHNNIRAEQRKEDKRQGKPTYEYKKTEGIEEVKPQPKPIKKPSPASQRWAKMTWMELDKELMYYGIDYGQAQVAAENNTLPEDFGLKREKVK